jgi:heme/copper-type cytochrome/quinol oxidase subunit 3
LYNTMILITSGFSVTWAHRSVCLGWYRDAIDALGITIILGFFFIYLQANEYYEAFFNYSDGVYGCSFYMLTGLHGCHVIVGAGALLVCFIRLLRRHYLTTHYLGFVFAIWYWHFVDAVWIVLFLLVYCWGGW